MAYKEKISTTSILTGGWFMRRSIHASEDMDQGGIIKENNIKITRPFDGIGPRFLDIILGKQIKNNVKKDEPIKWGDLL